MNFLSKQNPEMFYDKRVIVRVDFNVPVTGGVVSSDEAFRIRAVAPTIDFLKNAGAKIILISHIGRSGDSLHGVADYIATEFPQWGMQFVSEITGEQVDQQIAQLENGGCLLLENIRQHPGEETNDPSLAQQLAGMGECFVNDAFAVSHRAHASIVGIPKTLGTEHCYGGLLMEQELQNLESGLSPISPSTLIMAGIKFETKLPLIEKLLPLYDIVILGGGLLNTYLRALGMETGKSVIDDSANLSSIIGNPKIIIPESVIVERNSQSETIPVSEITKDDIIVDVVMSEKMKQILHTSKTVVWNGPLGWYEKGYTQSTRDIVSCLGQETHSIVGGGDTVTVIHALDLQDNISFVSTGGGAMLDYLQNGTIIGIQNL